MPRLSYLTHCQLLALVVLGDNLFNQLAVMAHDVIKGVFEGEEETGLCMELLCAPALGDEIDMLQPNRPQLMSIRHLPAMVCSVKYRMSYSKGRQCCVQS